MTHAPSSTPSETDDQHRIDDVALTIARLFGEAAARDAGVPLSQHEEIEAHAGKEED